VDLQIALRIDLRVSDVLRVLGTRKGFSGYSGRSSRSQGTTTKPGGTYVVG
jgi:hypothetical protein